MDNNFALLIFKSLDNHVSYSAPAFINYIFIYKDYEVSNESQLSIPGKQIRRENMC